MVLFVGRNREISNYGDFVTLLCQVFGLRLVDDMVWSPRWELLGRRHRVPQLLHFFIGPFREVPLACLPNICVSRNRLVFFPPIGKVEVPRNNAHIHFCIQSLDFSNLSDSLFCAIEAFQVHAVDSQLEGVWRILLGELKDSCEVASSHSRKLEAFLVEPARVLGENESVIPVHFHDGHEVVVALREKMSGLVKKIEEPAVDFLEANDVSLRLSQHPHDHWIPIHRIVVLEPDIVGEESQ